MVTIYKIIKIMYIDKVEQELKHQKGYLLLLPFFISFIVFIFLFFILININKLKKNMKLIN